MCGRTACTLAPDEICKAAALFCNKNGKICQTPAWQDAPGGHSYYPSANTAPSKFTPVMVSKDVISGTKRDESGEAKDPETVILPMMWGFIPAFYKGPTPWGHGYKTINCRLEDIEEKKIYKPSLVSGKRCVVLCDGFYEWQTTKGDKSKQPYLVYAPQPKGVEIWNRESWENREDLGMEKGGWQGPQLLRMAGLFSKWISSEGEEVYSYTVITMGSGKTLSWLHNRMPAILETDDMVMAWLNSSDVKYAEALSQLTSEVSLESHPVSVMVNNSRNNDPACMAPVSLKKKPPSDPSSKLMFAWLSSGKSSKEEKPIKTESSDDSKEEN